jgi:exonuclease VII small subunit
MLWNRITPMIETRVAPLEARVAPLEERIAPLEARVAPLEERIAPLEERVAPLEERIVPLEERVAPLESRVVPLEACVRQLDKGWRQHVPAFLNAISSVRALGFELSKTSQELNQLRQRIEFVRREIFFELKDNLKATPAIAGRDAKTKVIAEDKLAAAQAAGLRINLGCGQIPLEGYINVDERELPGVDVVADVSDLPIESKTVQEIFSAHLVEFFPQELLRRRLLPYWRNLLAPGGVFRAIVSDCDAMIGGVALGNYPFEEFREVLFGAQEHTGDMHLNILTPTSFSALLYEAGFTDITVPVKARRNGKCFEFEIRALRLE